MRGGNGSAAGGAGGSILHAADWTKWLDAVYLFEDLTDLGLDSSGKGNSLTVGNVMNDTTVFKQGSRAAFFQAGAPHLTRSADAPFTTSTAFTLGGWFRVPQATTSLNVARRVDSTGFALVFAGQGNHVRCRTADVTAPATDAPTPDDSWPPDTWVHVTCVWDNGAITAYAGSQGSSANGAVVAHPQATFNLGMDNGYADEVYFHTAALEPASVLRIQHCGIDGRGCECDSAAPSSYATCGGGASCADLAPCNQVQP